MKMATIDFEYNPDWYYSNENNSSYFTMDGLKKHLTSDKKKLMSRSEVKLYKWILKKRHMIFKHPIYIWDTELIDIKYYLMYKKIPSKIINEEEKLQNKYRVKHYGKMGR